MTRDESLLIIKSLPKDITVKRLRNRTNRNTNMNFSRWTCIVGFFMIATFINMFEAMKISCRKPN